MGIPYNTAVSQDDQKFLARMALKISIPSTSLSLFFLICKMGLFTASVLRADG